MNAKYERMTAEELVTCLEREEVKITEIDLKKAKQREAFLTAIKRRPKLLSKIKGPNSEYYIVPALDVDPSYFIYLDKEQYTDEYAQKFLLFRLTEVDKNPSRAVKNDANLTVQRSMDNKVLLNYSFVSPDGDEVYYFDNELQVPASIKTAYKATLKIKEALTLIDKIDLHVTQLGRIKIKTTLTDIFDNEYKVFLSEYINENKTGYYSLCSSIGKIEEAFAKRVEKILSAYGVELTSFIIKKLAIPKDIQNRIENQAFQIRQIRADNDASNEFAKKSLENYEAKLAIEDKYPNGEHCLTEYEKDLALKRYLIKIGREDDGEVDHSIGIADSKVKVDETMDKKKDIIPELPEKTNVGKTVYIVSLVIYALYTLMSLFSNPSVGLLLLGIGTLVFGLIGVLCREKLQDKKVEITDEELGSTNNSTEDNK